MTYGPYDQVASVKDKRGTLFNYDPLNYRIQRTGGTLGNREYYLEAEYINNQLQTQYFRGLTTDELIAGYTYTNGTLTPSLYHHDQLTSVTGQTAHDGTTQQGLLYSAFGNTQSLTGSTQNRLRYTGRELDPDTSLYYYRARYYDPSIGRFISEDPLGFEAGINFYAYVGNNPVNNNDPSGEVALPLITGAVGAVAGAAGNAVGQVISNGGFDNFSFRNVGIAAGVGFVAGAAAPFTAVTYLGAAATGAVANVAQYGITQVANNQNITATGVAVNAVSGAVGGTLGGPIARASTRFSQTSQFIDPQLARSLNESSDAAVNTTIGTVARNVLGSTIGNVNYENVNFVSGPSLGAAGGFLLYPNKPNTNALISVYSK